MVKREARTAYIDALPGIGKILIVIFRGGWIDAITSCDAEDAEGLIKWFSTSGYTEEIRSFAAGEGLSALEGISKFEDWIAKKGIRREELPKGIWRQVSVIVEGLREYQRGKSGQASTDTQKY